MIESPIAIPHDQLAELQTDFAAQRFHALIGATLEHVTPGACTIALPRRDDLVQQHGFFHGGVISALAEFTGAFAAKSLYRGSDIMALEFKISYLRPGAGERLEAEGTVLRAGRTVITARVDIYAVDGESRKLCATALETLVPAPGTPLIPA